MTKGQKLSIAAILCAPIILGALLSALSSRQAASAFSPLQSKKIGLVEVADIIYSSDEYVRQLRALREDDGIAGVLLRVDSPGGAVAPSQEIYEEVMK